MKLLFDENISSKLCQRLENIYPSSQHLKFVSLERESDTAIWAFAKKEGFVIVTKDSDFNDLSVLNGFPPQVVWIKSGNSKVDEMENILRKQHLKIRTFFNEKKCGLIEIG